MSRNMKQHVWLAQGDHALRFVVSSVLGSARCRAGDQEAGMLTVRTSYASISDIPAAWSLVLETCCKTCQFANSGDHHLQQCFCFYTRQIAYKRSRSTSCHFDTAYAAAQNATAAAPLVSSLKMNRFQAECSTIGASRLRVCTKSRPSRPPSTSSDMNWHPAVTGDSMSRAHVVLSSLGFRGMRLGHTTHPGYE